MNDQEQAEAVVDGLSAHDLCLCSDGYYRDTQKRIMIHELVYIVWKCDRCGSVIWRTSLD
jgi:hypothetical protein